MDLVLGTLRSLRAHALRFSLTSLGLLWGAFMLTFLSGTTEGNSRRFADALERSGPRIVYMGGGSVLKQKVGERGARPVELEDADAERIAALADVAYASPRIQLRGEIVRAGRRTKLLNLEGVNEHARSIRNWEVASGRFLSRLDVERAARVVFLGSEAAERLFGGESAVGRRLRIRDLAFRVVGVGVEKGNELLSTLDPDDRRIVLPYTTAQRWLTREDEFAEIVYEPVSREASWRTPRRVRELAGPHHGFPPDLETALWFFNIQEAVSVMNGVMLALHTFLTAASLVTLFVGAVGVMNIMLVVVGERTAEIGLKKALGARDRSIFAEFLAESMAVSVGAGLVGTAAGVAAALLVSWSAPPGSALGSPPIFDPGAVVTVGAALTGVGILSGVLPALRAMRVPPAEALRAL